MTLYIKNMVCDRCKLVVRQELEKLDVEIVEVLLGEVVLKETLAASKLKQLETVFQNLGFEIIDDRKSRIIEQVKKLVLSQVQVEGKQLKSNLSDFLSDKLKLDYNYISNLFSEVEGTTIEKYYISLKIEKVKELLVYDELTLNEIAFRLNYSSVAYLSNQFKKVTGLTPSHFKTIKGNKRKPLDKL